jgi:hypothetical protein
MLVAVAVVHSCVAFLPFGASSYQMQTCKYPKQFNSLGIISVRVGWTSTFSKSG